MGKEKIAAPVFLVLSTKGGAGKSTLSQQILASYNLARYGKSEIVELDDENLDSSWLSKSGITARQVELGDDRDEIAMAISAAIPVGAEGLVIDVGGNRTANIVIRELNRLTARAMQIDAVCIPVSDNRMGVENAIKTLESIQQSPMGSTLLPKCFIALNRVRNTKIETSDDPRLERRFRKVIDMASTWGLDILVVNDMDGVENLAPIGMTVLEVADRRSEFVADLNSKILDASKSGDSELLILLDDLQWAVNVATDDFAPLIRRAHDHLDTILARINKKGKAA